VFLQSLIVAAAAPTLIARHRRLVRRHRSAGQASMKHISVAPQPGETGLSCSAKTHSASISTCG